MKLRSMLFVPGDSERKFERASASDADALILDLEDSVALAKKAEARKAVAGIIDDPTARDWRLFVRINALDSGLALADLAEVVKPGLDAVMIPKGGGGADLLRVGHYLDALEYKAGMTPGVVKVAVVATETPAAMFALSTYTPAHPRLVALTWGAEDLSAALGATTNRETNGAWTFPYELARANCLFAAGAAAAMPIETSVHQLSRRRRLRGRLPPLASRRFFGPSGDPPRPGRDHQPRLCADRSRDRVRASRRRSLRGQPRRRGDRHRRQDARLPAPDRGAQNAGFDLRAGAKGAASKGCEHGRDRRLLRRHV